MFQMPVLRQCWRRPIAAGMLIVSLLALAGCGHDEKSQPWDGDWTRRVEVPSGVAGRCIDESLHIDRGLWRLKAIIHATYSCTAPTLELVYEGVLGKVSITRQTPTLDANITVDTLKLAKVANISRGQRDYLGKKGVQQTAQAQMPISVAGETLAAPIFAPLWAVAYSDAPYQDAMTIYTRVSVEK